MRSHPEFSLRVYAPAGATIRPASGHPGWAGITQRPVRLVAAGLACALLQLGCSGPQPADQMVVEPVLRFYDEFAVLPPAQRLAQGNCRLGDDIRPAFGCLSGSELLDRGKLRGIGGEDVELEFEARPRVSKDLILLRPTVITKRADGLGEPVKATVGVARGAETGASTVRGRWPHAQPSSEWQPVLLATLRVPPARQVRVSAPTRIGPGARILFSTGYDPHGTVPEAQPAALRLRVRRAPAAGASPADEEIFGSTVEPAAGIAAWQDHEIALDRLAGETVRFVFESEIVPGDRGGDLRFTLPLWGAPRLVEPRRRGSGRNVVLISLDTLRADQLGGTLDDRAIMPELDRWASGGARFSAAMSAYPSTTGSHMSLFTGLYPIAHRTVAADQRLAPTIPTLAELLALDGWATAAFTEDAMLNAGSGFSRGFDFYREFRGSSAWESAGMAREGVDAALAWLEKHANERFFLFLHTYQVHSPYLPPKEFDVFSKGDHSEAPAGVDPTTWQGTAEEERRRYSGEARYLDGVVKKLMDGLDRLGLDPSTIVVVTADHGEEFEEHGGRGHSAALYEESLHVPLVVRAPDLISPGQTVADPVSLIDVVPTLLDLLGVRAPAFLHGVSLEPAMLRGAPVPSRALFAENKPSPPFSLDNLLAARQGSSKWIFRKRDGQTTLEAYDLATDPAERHPIENPALHHKAELVAGGYMKLGGKAPPPPATPLQPVEPETRRKLRALGYVE